MENGCWGISVDPSIKREAPGNYIQVGQEDTDEAAAQKARKHFEAIYFRFLNMPEPQINDRGIDRRRLFLVTLP